LKLAVGPIGVHIKIRFSGWVRSPAQPCAGGAVPADARRVR